MKKRHMYFTEIFYHQPSEIFKYNASTILRSRRLCIYFFLFSVFCSCNDNSGAPTNYNILPDISHEKDHAIIVLGDPTKSATQTYGIEQITLEKIFLLIDKTAYCGGADIYIYNIDEDCRNNQPLFIPVPSIPTSPHIKRMSIGDEEYENYKNKEIERFHIDSINAVKVIQEFKLGYQKKIENFLTKMYEVPLDWTDAIGALNNAIATLSTEKYKTYKHKEIVTFSDLEQSLPVLSKYKPLLQEMPSDIAVIMISGTTGQKAIIKKYIRVPDFDLYLSTIF